MNLQEELDRRLQQRQARETGIFPIREELYAQCLEELIMQATIICAERGLLLLRVRDEIRMTVSAYQSLYEFSIAFGMRKALQAEQRRKLQDGKVKELLGTTKELQDEVHRLNARIEDVERRASEQRDQVGPACLVLSCLVLSCLVLYCIVLSCLHLSSLILS